MNETKAYTNAWEVRLRTWKDGETYRWDILHRLPSGGICQAHSDHKQYNTQLSALLTAKAALSEFITTFEIGQNVQSSR